MYDIVKAVHLIAVVTALCGMAVVTLALRWIALAGSEAVSFGHMVLAFDRTITIPALACTWIAGFAIAADAGFLSSGWLLVKLCFVVALSGLHAMQGMALRSYLSGKDVPVHPVFRSPWLLFCLDASTILLVVLKPAAP